MTGVQRAYVVKQATYDVEAQGILKDLRTNLGLTSLAGLTIVNRYDVEGLSREEYTKARQQIFMEPMVDHAYDEEYPCDPLCKTFCMEYLPGQYDQRADSAMQCIALLIEREATVKTARLIVLQGDLSDQDVDLVSSYMINPVESRLAQSSKPDTLASDYPAAQGIEVLVGFIKKDLSQLQSMQRDRGLAMTCADLLCVQGYFAKEELRDPTMTELRVIDTYWSDHCRHTTFLTTLDQVTFDSGMVGEAIERSFLAYMADREALGRTNPPSLMDIALTGPRLLKARGILHGVDESEEINACSIRTTITVDGKEQEWLVMFKNETHNHPTEIEPFGGAATCLGGAIRDPLSGRSYVYQAMRVTGASDPTAAVSQTLEGKLPQRKITVGAATGFSSYGNQIGLATGQVREIYHPGYIAKRMEIGAVIGAAPLEHVVREVPAPGDAIVLLGGRTGRDGCGGATGSSKEHTLDSLMTCGAEVQKGNPVTERKIQRLFRDPAITRKIKRCNDFGAGGVSVAIGEMAPGLTIDLDVVPRKYEGLDGTELAISESQERMAVVVDPSDVEALLQAAAKENLEATVVAIVTKEERLRMIWRGHTIVDVARDFLDTNGAEQHAKAHVASPDLAAYPYAIHAHADRKLWLDTMADLNVASQQGLSERFDSTIGANSVLLPFSGKHQKTPVQAIAAKLPVLEGETTAATIMTHGFDPKLSSWSPFHGAVAAVIESLARLVAAGGDHEAAYLTFQEYFERLREEPSRWGKPVAALLGALEAQKQMGVASIGGKDSMSGSFLAIDVPPTLVSFAVCVSDVATIQSCEFKRAGNKIVYASCPATPDGLPDWAYQKRLFAFVRDGIRSGGIVSASAIGYGGIAEAVTKMCFGNGLGASLTQLPSDGLYQPLYGAFVLETTDVIQANEIETLVMGSVTAKADIVAGDLSLSLQELLAAYEQPLASVFPLVASPVENQTLPVLHAVPAPAKRSAPLLARPRVFVPTFPGTNCETDTARAFEREGALVEVGVVRNRSTKDIHESVLAFEKSIRTSQIIAFPGGFSAGDEPEGSAKFIVSFMSHPRLKDAIMDLLKNRDGLILGICNGFQALVKLGLAPFGEYVDMQEGAPTLTFNTIGRHVSHMVETRVGSCLSPWYADCQVGECHTIAVSHGEGRFVAPKDVLDRLARQGQITTQYVDPLGQPTYDPNYNVNGSSYAIEGICSPDGRVLGKMGHSERQGNGVCVNIPGDKNDKIFQSGVRYFA